MLEVARRNAPIVAERIGFANVEFRRGRIQDLALDLDRLEQELAATPVDSVERLLADRGAGGELRRDEPLVADDSIDVVVSNCVLNLVENGHKEQLFDEIYRVLKRGGRAVISDIVSDEEVPRALQEDPELWSGCISGAFTERASWPPSRRPASTACASSSARSSPGRTVDGIEFRSLTVEAFKGKEGPCWERNQAVIYRGPFKEVTRRRRPPHAARRALRGLRQDLSALPPGALRRRLRLRRSAGEVPLAEATPFDCSRT